MPSNGDIRTIRVLEFLHAYEKQESLWNPTLESYKNKAARDEAYMCIINDLNMPSLTIHDVKLKVKSIRTTYTKELRLLIKNKEEGKSYTPKLFWFSRAHVFLRNVSLSRDKKTGFSNSVNVSSDKKCKVNNNANDLPKQRTESTETISNIESTSLNSYDYKGLQGTSITENIANDMPLEDKDQVVEIVSHEKSNITEESLHPAVINPKFNEDPLADVSENSPNLLNTVHLHSNNTISANTADDEYDIFCRSVAAQLRGISDNYSRSVAKLKIQQILFEAETGHYRNNPCITIPVNHNISDL